MNEQAGFVCLKKICILWTVLTKSVRLQILWNEIESSQNT